MKTATQPQKEEFNGITITLSELIASKPFLTELFSKPLKKESAYKIKSILRQLNTIMVDYEKNRIELCKQFGTLNPKTGIFDIPDDKQEEFDLKYTELVAEDKQIVAKPLKLSDLGNSEFTANFMFQLDWLITDK